MKRLILFLLLSLTFPLYAQWVDKGVYKEHILNFSKIHDLKYSKGGTKLYVLVSLKDSGEYYYEIDKESGALLRSQKLKFFNGFISDDLKSVVVFFGSFDWGQYRPLIVDVAVYDIDSFNIIYTKNLVNDPPGYTPYAESSMRITKADFNYSNSLLRYSSAHGYSSYKHGQNPSSSNGYYSFYNTINIITGSLNQTKDGDFFIYESGKTILKYFKYSHSSTLTRYGEKVDDYSESGLKLIENDIPVTMKTNQAPKDSPKIRSIMAENDTLFASSDNNRFLTFDINSKDINDQITETFFTSIEHAGSRPYIIGLNGKMIFFYDYRYNRIIDKISLPGSFNYIKKSPVEDAEIILIGEKIALLRLKMIDKSLFCFFSCDSTIKEKSNAVKFYDYSAGSPTSWKWYFGDGDSSISQNPVHAYKEKGYYTVTLIVTDGLKNDTLTKLNYVNIRNNILIDFEANPKDGVYPLEVSFENLSQGDSLQFKWYANGEYFSSDAKPVKVFNEGIYDIKLEVSDGFLTKHLEKKKYINSHKPVIDNIIEEYYYNPHKAIMEGYTGPDYRIKYNDFKAIQNKDSIYAEVSYIFSNAAGVYRPEYLFLKSGLDSNSLLKIYKGIGTSDFDQKHFIGKEYTDKQISSYDINLKILKIFNFDDKYTTSFIKDDYLLIANGKNLAYYKDSLVVIDTLDALTTEVLVYADDDGKIISLEKLENVIVFKKYDLEKNLLIRKVEQISDDLIPLKMLEFNNNYYILFSKKNSFNIIKKYKADFDFINTLTLPIDSDITTLASTTKRICLGGSSNGSACFITYDKNDSLGTYIELKDRKGYIQLINPLENDIALLSGWINNSCYYAYADIKDTISDNIGIIGKETLFPNPANNIIKMIIDIEFDQTVSIEVYDINAVSVETYDYNLFKGKNIIEVLVSKLSQGKYFLKIKSSGLTRSIPFVIMR